jgi:hypothetical protein
MQSIAPALLLPARARECGPRGRLQSSQRLLSQRATSPPPGWKWRRDGFMCDAMSRSRVVLQCAAVAVLVFAFPVPASAQGPYVPPCPYVSPGGYAGGGSECGPYVGLPQVLPTPGASNSTTLGGLPAASLSPDAPESANEPVITRGDLIGFIAMGAGVLALVARRRGRARRG